MRGRVKNRRLGFIGTLVAAASLLLAAAAPASAAPQLRLDALANTNAAPGSTAIVELQMANLGDTSAVCNTGACTLQIEVPAGLTPLSLSPYDGGFGNCIGLGVPGPTTVSCKPASPVTFTHLGSSVATLNASVAPGAEPGTILSTRFRLYGPGLVLPGGGSCAAAPPGTPCAQAAETVTVSEAQTPLGFHAFDVKLTRDPAGSPFTEAGGHPYAFLTYLQFNRRTDERLEDGNPLASMAVPAEQAKNVFVDLPPGFLGNPSSLERCPLADVAGEGASTEAVTQCPQGSQVGTVFIDLAANGGAFIAFGPLPVFNVEPRPGTPATFAFNVANTVVAIDTRLRYEDDYGISVGTRNTPEGLAVAGAEFEFWGDPGDPSHDPQRVCSGESAPSVGLGGNGPSCATKGYGKAFLRVPTQCTGQGLPWSASMDSWPNPGAQTSLGAPVLSDPRWATASLVSHEVPGFPLPPSEWGGPQSLQGCDDVQVQGKLSAEPTARDTETSSGLRVRFEVPSAGLENSEGVSASDIESVKVTLPQGVTLNPSQAEGLGVCSPAQYESTVLSFHPVEGKGCPEDSKIGTVELRTPLLKEQIPGSVYVAQPYQNPFASLLAIYVVMAEPERGVLVKLAGKVSTDPVSGRIITTFDDLPQQPFSSFDFKFREGARAPLVTPPTCGTYTTRTEIAGYSDPANPIVSESGFVIDRGIGGGPCPSDGVRPFKPGFTAGSINNNAGSYSPFSMRLTRKDGEQDLTKFSSVLPKGVAAKIAGLAKCPEASIAAAKTKSGLQERANPSCPGSAQIGRSLAGAGVGSVLTYVPGSIYLAGPWHGAPLSAVAITPAVAGPFDVGTVVVREALELDPQTGVVSVDGSASDPIPHILEGIPLKLRDLRVYVDRPKFTINPTSCDPGEVGATLFGSNLDVFDPADDVPVGLSSRYQAASCAGLAFKPKLRIELAGGVKRGRFPALRATYAPRPGDANLGRAAVVLPRSAFLEQGHIRTICTRAQFAAGDGFGSACPKGSVYGHVSAKTPLLDDPLTGPVYLRSSSHKLPDMVLALRGVVDIEAVGRIDSVRLGGGDFGIRSIFASLPDAPLTKVVLDMQGGQKGLIVNSRHLCFQPGKNRARLNLVGQNGKASAAKPVVRSNGCRKKQAKRHHRPQQQR